jgi:PGF-pre-PGF domain-containing protein
VYNVTLIAANEAGNSTVTKPNYITVTPPQAPVADFSTNVTSGTAPLTVLFAATGIGEAPTSWYWDFGDGINSKNATVIHTFTKPGNYTISLTVGNIIGNNTTTKPGYIVVTDPNAPVANFSSNLTGGCAPLTIQFNDFSQKATSRIWDFNGDGQPDSSEINPVYVYANPGTYTVNLTVSNSNGTDSKYVIVTVLQVPEICYGTTSSGSGGGSVGGSQEPQSNVEAKEVSQTFIGNGNSVNFAFPQNATPVMKISFDSKTTVGKTTTIVEMLKNQSTLVSEPPSDEIYKFINIWVGSGGVISPDKIKNAVVNLKVEKSWIQDKNIDKSSITLNRYNDTKWNALPTNMSGEDDKYLYFIAQTPGFSTFAITGKSTATGIIQPAVDKTQNPTVSETQKNITDGSTAVNTDKTPEQRKSPSSSEKGNTKISGFEIICGIVGLFAVVLYKTSKKGN